VPRIWDQDRIRHFAIRIDFTRQTHNQNINLTWTESPSKWNIWQKLQLSGGGFDGINCDQTLRHTSQVAGQKPPFKFSLFSNNSRYTKRTTHHQLSFQLSFYLQRLNFQENFRTKYSWTHWMVYCTYNMLNMFRALLCPSSGARGYMCVITAYGVQYLGCWWSEVRCRAAGYASGMRDVARRCRATMHGQKHIKFTAEPVYNEIGLCDTSFIARDILSYQLIPHS